MESTREMSCLLTSKVKIFSQPQVGLVEQAITDKRRGRVKFDGTYWPARFYYSHFIEEVYPDQLITVVGMEGITVLVMPLERAATYSSFIYFPLDDEVIETQIPWKIQIQGSQLLENWHLPTPLF